MPEELEVGDCSIALSLAHLSGLIVTGRVGKHTDELTEELVFSTQGKSDSSEWHTDGLGGYERVLCHRAIENYVSIALIQPSERTNGIVRDSNWTMASATKHERLRGEGFLPQLSQICAHCCSFAKVSVRLVISYFNWIWQHTRLDTTAAQRADLALHPWTWNDLVTYPTLC